MTTIQINGGIDFQTLHTKLSLLEHCCITCQDAWQKWNMLITNVLDAVDNFKTCPWKLSNTLIDCLTNMPLLQKLFLISDYYYEVIGTQDNLSLFESFGLSKDDLNPLKLMNSKTNLNKFIKALDLIETNNDEVLGSKPIITGAAKYYLTHVCSRLLMSKLSSIKIKELLQMHTLIHRQYIPAHTGLYPFIKIDGSKYIIKKISHVPLETITGPFDISTVKAFIKSSDTQDKRIKRYANISVQTIVEPDGPLHMQQGVFANNDIANNTCIGVHSGIILLKNDDIFKSMNQDYIVECSKEYYLDGLNIISKINSNFEQKLNKWCESSSGYNVRAVGFQCEMEDSKILTLHAIVTIVPIKKGEELRMKYDYSNELTQQAMNTFQATRNLDIADVLKQLKSLSI
jgi:hypothetical protein